MTKELSIGILGAYMFVFSVITLKTGIFYYFLYGTGWPISIATMMTAFDDHYDAIDIFPIFVLWASLPLMIWITKDLKLWRRAVLVCVFEMFLPVVILYNYSAILN